MVESPHSIDRLVADSERLRGRLSEVAQDLELFVMQLQEAARDLSARVERLKSEGDCNGPAGDSAD